MKPPKWTAWGSDHPFLTRVLELISVAGVILLIDFFHFFAFHRSYISEYVLTANLPVKFAGASWKLDGFPTWNSGLAAGWPVLADALSLPLDWRNVFYFLFDPVPAYWAALFASRFIGASILFLYLRLRHGLRFSAALPATFVYFCGTLIMEDSRLAGAAVWDLLPGYLWLTERLLDRLSAGRVVAIAAYCFLMYTMGSFGFLICVGPMAGLWALALFLGGAHRDWMHFALFTIIFLGANALGLALTGVTLLPFIEFVLNSNRGDEYGSDPFALRSVFFALFGPHDQYNQVLPPFNFILYVGVISIPLILTGIRRKTGAHAAVLPWLSIAVIALTVLLCTPLKVSLVKVLPPMATISGMRLTPFWGFLAALAVGFALDSREWQPTGAARLLTLFLSALQASVPLVLLLAGGLWLVAQTETPEYLPAVSELLKTLGPFATPIFLIVLAIRLTGLLVALFPGGLPRLHVIGALLLLELTVTMAYARPSTEVKQYYPDTPEVAFLKRNNSPDFRVMAIAPAFMRKDWDSFTSLMFNAQLMHGLSSANFYHSLIIKNYSDLFADFGDLEERKATYRRGYNQIMYTFRPASPLMDALAVRYIVSALPLYDPKNDVLRLSRRLTGANYDVYERPDPMPRAFFVSRAEFLDLNDIHARLREIARGAFTEQKLRTYVLIDNATVPLDLKALIAGHGASTVERFAAARIREDAQSSVTVELDAPTDGWLVLSDAYYPGWKAQVDDHSVPILRANGFARAIPVRAGAHQVKFTFAPNSVRNGIWLSAGAALITIGLLLLDTFFAAAWSRGRHWRDALFRFCIDRGF